MMLLVLLLIYVLRLYCRPSSCINIGSWVGHFSGRLLFAPTFHIDFNVSIYFTRVRTNSATRICFNHFRIDHSRYHVNFTWRSHGMLINCPISYHCIVCYAMMEETKALRRYCCSLLNLDLRLRQFLKLLLLFKGRVEWCANTWQTFTTLIHWL